MDDNTNSIVDKVDLLKIKINKNHQIMASFGVICLIFSQQQPLLKNKWKAIENHTKINQYKIH